MRWSQHQETIARPSHAYNCPCRGLPPPQNWHRLTHMSCGCRKGEGHDRVHHNAKAQVWRTQARREAAAAVLCRNLLSIPRRHCLPRQVGLGANFHSRHAFSPIAFVRLDFRWHFVNCSGWLSMYHHRCRKPQGVHTALPALKRCKALTQPSLCVCTSTGRFGRSFVPV